MRTQEQIGIIQDRAIDPYIVDNFLSESEILYLISLFEQDQRNRIHKNTGPITLNLDRNDPIVRNILSRIQDQIGEHRITAAFFFYTETPHIIHNDDTFELPDVYRGITLPLRIGGTEIPKLCFFDQFYFHGPAKFFQGEHDIPTYYNKCIYDYTDVYKWKSNESFDETIHTSYLQHLKSSWLEGLTWWGALDWIPGNALIFDSTRLHCASDFRKQNITSKLGISVFTRK